MRGIMRPAATVRRPRSGRPWATGAASPRCAAPGPRAGFDPPQVPMRPRAGRRPARSLLRRGASRRGVPRWQRGLPERARHGRGVRLPGPKRRCPQSQPLPPRADQHRLDHRHRPVVRVRAWKMNVPAAAPHPSSHSRCRTRYSGSRQPLSRFSARDAASGSTSKLLSPCCGGWPITRSRTTIPLNEVVTPHPASRR